MPRLKLNNEKVSDTSFIVEIPQEETILQAGKRKFMKLEVNK